MTLTQLRYVLAIIDQSGFMRAAEHCHVTQPTMSAQIKRLEDELGVQLFERTGHGIHVTPVGQQIVQHARILVEQEQAIKSVAYNSGGFPAGSVRMGVVSSIAPALVKTSIRAVREELDNLKIEVQEGNPSDLIVELKNHTIDLIVGTRPINEPGLSWLPLFWEPYIASCREYDQMPAKDYSRQDLLNRRLQSYVLDEGGAAEPLSTDGASPGEFELQDYLGWKLEKTRNVTSIATLNALLCSSDCLVIAPFTATSMITETGLFHLGVGTPNMGRVVGFIWRSSYPWTPRCYEIYEIVHANLPVGVTALAKSASSQITLGPKDTMSSRNRSAKRA